MSDGVLDMYEPTAHVCQLVQLDAPAPENELAAQVVHETALVVLANVPALHDVQALLTELDGRVEA